MTTTRTEIRNQILTALSGISTFTTIETDVTRNPEQEPFAPEECPAALLSYGAEEVDELVSFDEHHLPVTLEIYTSTASASDQNPEELFQACMEIIGANPTWGGYADGTNSPKPDLRPVWQSADILFNGTLSFIVHYTTARGSLNGTQITATPLIMPQAVVNEPVNITYAQLAALAVAENMTPGRQYRITDFASHSTNSPAVIEPLIVRAADSSNLFTEAYSATHPGDIIRYDLDKSGRLIPYGYTHGRITWRKDPVWNITAHNDFRNYSSVLWFDDISGAYTNLNDPGNGLSQQFPMFDPAKYADGSYRNIHIGDSNENRPPIVFMDQSEKISVGDAGDGAVFCKPAFDIFLSTCSTFVAAPAIQGIFSGPNSSLRFRGAADCYSISSGPQVQVFEGGFTGSVYKCNIMPGYYDYGIPIADNFAEQNIGYPIPN